MTGISNRWSICLLSTLACLMLPLAVMAVDSTVDDETARQTVKRFDYYVPRTGSDTQWPPVSSDSTADHSSFPILQQEFATGPDVTRACLSCHTEAAKQVQKTIHWTWVCPKSMAKVVGKRVQIINNFCISLQSNEPRCTSCHAGYGWKDKDFDFTIEENVDCLVCHDNTNTYKKFPAGAGHPVYETTEFGGKVFEPLDLRHIAQNIGKPTRHNCGVCHFFGGGGEGVKHGDLDHTLFNPSRELDVHMSADGANFRCTMCHTTHAHEIAGRCFSIPTADEQEQLMPGQPGTHLTCVSCHSQAPHTKNAKLNDHTDKVACQTCHIPEFAREKPTKMWWDWSKAGQEFDENHKPITRKDAQGNITYMTKKGEFRWEKNVVPEYYWFNGEADNVTVQDTIDDTGVVTLNPIHGSKDDPTSRIWPFKVHRGKQVYDAKTKNFVVPKLFGSKESGAYWKNYDWQKAVQTGMDYCDQEFSGEVGFVETAMFWPITHMVAPAEDAVSCEECHQREDGRMATLTGFYMPGRDRFALLDKLGGFGILAAFLVVFLHGSARWFFGSRSHKGDQQ